MVSPTSLNGSMRGAVRPRVEVAPSYAYTFGPEACELMARAGQVMDPWQADAVDLLHAFRADDRFACFEYAELVGRQNGKGGILEARALAGLFLLGEKLIMWSAHEYKTAMEAFRRMRSLIRVLGTPVSETVVDFGAFNIKVSNTNGEEGFERTDTGQRIKFIARSKSSGRGFSGDLNIIDEAFAYTADQHDALLPTMSARPNPQIVYMSSPPLSGDTGEILYQLRERAEAGGDDGLGYRDWGLAGDLDHLEGVDLDDRGLWAAANPAFGIRITPEFVKRERRSLNPRGFARERLGIWPRRINELGGVLDMERWAGMGDPESKRAGDVAVAVDIATNREWASVLVFGVRGDDLGHAQLVDYRAGTDWIVDRLIELRDALDPLGFAMARGTAASLETELGKAGIRPPDNPEEPVRGDLAVLGAVDMAAACGQVIDAVRQQSFRYVPSQVLDLAAAGAKTRQVGDTIAWSRKNADTDISPVVTLTEARWLFEKWVHLVTGDYDVLASVL